MSNDALSYLNLISQHLEEGHAVLFVGAGFGRNADKISTGVPDMPLWNDLSRAFVEKIGDPSLQGNANPLKLAEYVQTKFGRPVLDRLLLETIQDSSYLPNELYEKLLSLPWKDIFTTNYDTLLERTCSYLPEKRFKVITSKEDINCSRSDGTRIIKLHGSFPSSRPFIITSEDYRKYPTSFAPFVNTVQQALLENTLCMIGFSGDDPNFKSWIGWIRDNLGEENTPKMYLLTHHKISEIQRSLLEQYHIITVDLSETFSDVYKGSENTKLIYNAMLDYLWNCHLKYYKKYETWNYNEIVELKNTSTQNMSIKQYMDFLKEIDKTCPKCLSLPPEINIFLSENFLDPAFAFLDEQLSDSNDSGTDLINFLSILDRVCNRALYPINRAKLKIYEAIIDYISDKKIAYSAPVFDVHLSLLRTFRELSIWKKWNDEQKVLKSNIDKLSLDQQHRFHWEECLALLSKYEFLKLKKALNLWQVSSNEPIWILRKASLLVESGKLAESLNILKSAIFAIRKQIHRSVDKTTVSSLLSIESALMTLYEKIQISRGNLPSKQGNSQTKFFNEYEILLQKQYEVSWTFIEENYEKELSKPRTIHKTYEERQAMDLGKIRSTIHFGTPKNSYVEYSYLRFHEETGAPFVIETIWFSPRNNVISALKKLVIDFPELSILTLVRTNLSKESEQIINRKILYHLKQEKVDLLIEFYINTLYYCLKVFNSEAQNMYWSVINFAASVIPYVLSILCLNSSPTVHEKLFELIFALYGSSNSGRFGNIEPLVKRFFEVYHIPRTNEFKKKIANVQLTNGLSIQNRFPDLLQYLPLDPNKQFKSSSKKVINFNFSNIPTQNNDEVIYCLFQCFNHGLLTKGQIKKLEKNLWHDGKLCNSGRLLCSACLDLPDLCNDYTFKLYLKRYLDECFKNFYETYTKSLYPSHVFLEEVYEISLHHEDFFTNSEITQYIDCLTQCVFHFISASLRSSHSSGLDDFYKEKAFEIQDILWLISIARKKINFTAQNKSMMTRYRNLVKQNPGYLHYGLYRQWSHFLHQKIDAEKFIVNCLRPINEISGSYLYSCFGYALNSSKISAFSNQEYMTVIKFMARQINWCLRSNLTSALSFAIICVKKKVSFLDQQLLEEIIEGMDQLLADTLLGLDDPDENSEELVEKNCSIRNNCLKLAKALHESGEDKFNPDPIQNWLALVKKKNEFSDVINV